MDTFLSALTSTVASVKEEIATQVQMRHEEGLGVHYITRRILACGFPYDDSEKTAAGAVVALPVPSSSSTSASASGVSVRQLSTFLHKNYPDRFMLWNISEKSYNYSSFDQQVIEFRFPGYPACPLNQVFSLCNSLHAWLTADENNVALVHCQTGRGRTICAIAWYLAWSGQIASVPQAVSHVCRRLGVQQENVLIPTQTRYLDYLSKMLAGKRPDTRPMKLERVIMNGIPKMSGNNSSSSNGSSNDADSSSSSVASPSASDKECCRPYLQIFRDGRLIYTSTGRDSTELRWYSSSDGCVLFPVNLTLDGDILIRIRHLSKDNQRISMLRFGFHTGFIQPGNTRFTKEQLDGAYADSRFDDKQFWIDAIFRVAESDEASTIQDEAERKKQEEYWNQINSARRQTKPEKAGVELQAPMSGRVQMTASKSASPPPTAAAAAASSSSAAAASSTTTPAASSSTTSATFGTATSALASKTKSLGSLLSSAGSSGIAKLSTFSLWGGGGASASSDSTSAAAADPDANDPEVQRLRAIDEAAIRKAKRKAATDAAVQAALAFSPARKIPPPAASVDKQSMIHADSFEELQAYVSGLGALDKHSIEVDSDEEGTTTSGSSSSSGVKVERPGDVKQLDAKKKKRATHTSASPPGEVDLMSDHFASPLASPTATKGTLDLLTDTTIPASNTSAAASSTAASTVPASTAKPVLSASSASTTLDDSTSAALEAELAALDIDGTDDIDFAALGEGEELDDADEAALLASLQEESKDE